MVEVSRPPGSGASASLPSLSRILAAQQKQQTQTVKQTEAFAPPQTVPFAKESVQSASHTGQASGQLTFVDAEQDPCQTLEQRLNTSFSNQNTPPQVREKLNSDVQNLKAAIANENPAQIQAKMQLLLHDLRQNSLLSGPVRQGLEEVQTALLQKQATTQNASLNPIYLGSRLVSYSSSSPELSDSGNNFVRSLRQSEKMPRDLGQDAKHTRQTLLLMSLRDELLRREFERARGHREGPMVASETETELPVIENGVKMIDQALASSRNLPPKMLADFQDMVQRIRDAKPGELLQNLTAPRLPHQKPLNLPDALTKPGQANLGDGHLPSLGNLTAPEMDLSAPNSPSLAHDPIKAPELGSVPRPSLPPEINRMAQELAQSAGKPMPNLHERFGEYMQQYTQIMDAVDHSLPPLYFPLTLPVPLAYNDGKTSFIMPPGTQLSQDRHSGEYSVKMPGFLVLNDGTAVVSKDISLNLGPELDGIQAEQMDLVNDQGHTHLEGVTAAISRSQQTAFIQADQVRIDDHNGAFVLNNARIAQDPEGFQASMDSLQMPDGSMGPTSITQYNQGDTAYLDGQTQNLNWLGENQAIQADELTLHMVQGPDGQQMVMDGQNIDVRDGDQLMHAASGQLQIQNHADGSGLIDLKGQDLSWQQGNQKLNSPGDTQLTLTRTDGYVDHLNVHSSDLNYSDGNRLGQMDNGVMDFRFNSEGALQSANVQADGLHWQDGQQVLNARQTQLQLNYDDDGNLALNGQSEHLNYRSGSDYAQVLGGSVALQTAGDHISSLNAHSDRIFWKNGHQELLAHDANLDLSTHSNGQLAQTVLQTGQLSYQNDHEHFKLNGSQSQLNFSDNGVLQSGQMALGDLQYDGSMGQLKTTGQTTLNGQFYDNGQLQSLQVSSENFNFANDDLKAAAQNTTVQLQANPEGQLQSLQAQNGGLNVQGDWGQLQTEGQSKLNLNYDNGQLASVNASSEHLHFQDEQNNLNLNGAQLQMQYQNGQLAQATGQIQDGTLAGAFGQAQLSEGDITLGFGNDRLQSVQASAGQFQLQNEQGQLDLTGSQLNAGFRPDGQLEHLNFSGDQAQFHGAEQPLDFAVQNFDLAVNQAEDGSQNLNFTGQDLNLDIAQNGGQQVHLDRIDQFKLQTHPDGSLSQAQIQLGGNNTFASPDLQGSVQNLQGQYNDDQHQLSLSFDQGQIQTEALSAAASNVSLYNDDQTLSTHAENLRYREMQQQLKFEAGSLDLLVEKQRPDGSSLIEVTGQDLHWQQGNQDLSTQGSSHLTLLRDANGQLRTLNASSDHLHFNNPDGDLQLDGAKMNLNFDDQGQLQNATGHVDSGHFAGKMGQVALEQGDVKLTFANDQMQQLEASAGQLSLNNDQGQLDLTGSQLKAQFGEDGQLDQLHFSGDAVQLKDNHNLNFGLQDFNLNVVQADDGSQNLNFTGQNLNLDKAGQQLHLDSIDQFHLQTNPDGSLSQMDLHLAGNNTYTDQDLQASAQNLQGHYNQDQNMLSVQFDKMNLQTPDLQVDATGGKFYNDDNLMSLHLDSAQVKQQLEQELNVKVERVDLLVDKNADGQVKNVDLGVGAADAQVKGMNVMVRTQNGDQVRLHMGMSDDGSFLKEAYLQIPDGGEIKLQQDDLKLRLGGGQKLSFSQDGQGYYTFRGEGLDIDAVTKDAKVSVKGGTAQVSVDSKNGDLIVDEITGVGVHAEVGGQKIDVDIKQMDGFLLKATGISGLAQGAAIHFVPTGEGSKMTAEIRTNYNGMPISVRVDDAHELAALASIQTNRAHVYFGDPSGQGHVSVKAGPLEMSGSAIEYVAQYNQYDPMRMMTTLSRALSSDGYEIVPGVSVEMDGVLRLQTPFKSGPHAGLTLLFPRPPMAMSGPEQFYQPGQAYSEAGDGAMGGIAELGWTHTNREGTQYTGALHAGLVPGSYLGLHQLQGTTKLGGITLPSNIELPTTAIAGVTFRRHGDASAVAKGEESRTDMMLGGYVNPAGLANSPMINEPNAYGVYAGAEWRKNNMSIGFSTTMDLSQDKPKVGGMLRVGISF